MRYTGNCRKCLTFVKASFCLARLAGVMPNSKAQPANPLGVALMDDDHAELEALIGSAAVAADEDLAALHANIVEGLEAHFAREEELMRERGFPGLHCHNAQHKLLVEQARGGRAMAPAALRRHIGVYVAQLVESHVLTMDYMTAAFLRGEFGPQHFEGLRLPIEPSRP